MYVCMYVCVVTNISMYVCVHVYTNIYVIYVFVYTRSSFGLHTGSVSSSRGSHPRPTCTLKNSLEIYPVV